MCALSYWEGYYRPSHQGSRQRGGEGQLGPELLRPASQVLKLSCLCPRILLAPPSNRKGGGGGGVGWKSSTAWARWPASCKSVLGLPSNMNSIRLPAPLFFNFVLPSVWVSASHGGPIPNLPPLAGLWVGVRRHQIRGRTLHLLLSFPVLTHQRYPTPPPLAPTLKRLLLSWTNS